MTIELPCMNSSTAFRENEEQKMHSGMLFTANKMGTHKYGQKNSKNIKESKNNEEVREKKGKKRERKKKKEKKSERIEREKEHQVKKMKLKI